MICRDLECERVDIRSSHKSNTNTCDRLYLQHRVTSLRTEDIVSGINSSSTSILELMLVTRNTNVDSDDA